MCARSCSVHCAGSDNECHHVHGVCGLGCDAGYKGSLCNQGKHDVIILLVKASWDIKKMRAIK